MEEHVSETLEPALPPAAGQARLEIRDGRSRAILPSAELLAGLCAEFTVTPRDAFYRARAVHAKGGRPGWDGSTQFVTPLGTFKTGLANRVHNWLHERGVEIEVQDFRLALPHDPSIPKLNLDFELWPEQLALVEEFLRVKRGIWHAATNSGKTEMTAEVLRRLGSSIALVVVPTAILLHQTARRLSEALGEPVGMLGDGAEQIERVTVATFQTLGAALDKPKPAKGTETKRMRETAARHARLRLMLKEIDLLVLDECHRAKASQIRQIGATCSASHVLAMSGTVEVGYKYHDWTVESVCGPVIGRITNAEQVAKGRSSPAVVFALMIPGPDAWEKLNYDQAKPLCVYENETRHQMIAETVQALAELGFPCLVMTESREHGWAMLEAASFLEIEAEWLDGHCDIETRESAIQRLAKGEFAAIYSTPIFREGVNAPGISAAIDAGTTGASDEASVISTLQFLGRILRKKTNGPNLCFYVIVADAACDNLANKAEKKLEVIEREECFPIEIVHSAKELKQVAERYLKEVSA